MRLSVGYGMVRQQMQNTKLCKEPKEQFVGRHLLVEGRAPRQLLSNKHLLKLVFDLLVDTLDMQYLQEPIFYEVPLDEGKLNTEEFQDEGGVTGFAVITTSHLSIHSWPLRGFFSMDIYSCRDFSPREAVDVLEAYGFTDLKVTNISRVF